MPTCDMTEISDKIKDKTLANWKNEANKNLSLDRISLLKIIQKLNHMSSGMSVFDLDSMYVQYYLLLIHSIML